jgi:hypothetical protein
VTDALQDEALFEVPPPGIELGACAICGAAFEPYKGRGSEPGQYCPEHRGKKAEQARRRARRAAGRDTAPGSVRVDVNIGKGGGRSKKDPALEAVERRAANFAGLIAVGLFALGAPEDAADVERGREAWAATVGHLAEYEPWLKRLAAGGETSDRALAWIQFAIATGALLTPILLRHRVLPEPIHRILAAQATGDADLFGAVMAEATAPPSADASTDGPERAAA